jgi:hypothetical protein
MEPHNRKDSNMLHLAGRFRETAIVALTVSAAACGARHGLESPIRSVDGTQYFTAEARCPRLDNYDFTIKLCRLSASSQLSQSRTSAVYVKLTQEQRARVEDLAARRTGRRDPVAGSIAFLDELTSRTALRDVRELKAKAEKKGELVLVLGIPMETWQELVDEAAEEAYRALRDAGGN